MFFYLKRRRINVNNSLTQMIYILLKIVGSPSQASKDLQAVETKHHGVHGKGKFFM